MAALAACGNSAPPSAVTNSHAVTITAGRFHFTPDRITLIKGQPVTLELASTDTTHGFMIRALKIDTDIKPGKITSITVTPLATGTFNAICDHYCGLGHGGMKMTVVVKDPTTARSAVAKIVTASNTLSR
jgi:cytochrome c oxidase subunit 2